jgi:hypothetical protein
MNSGIRLSFGLDEISGEEVEWWQNRRSWWPRCRSPTPYPTFGQLLIQNLCHVQMIMGWCPVLMEPRKALLQLGPSLQLLWFGPPDVHLLTASQTSYLCRLSRYSGLVIPAFNWLLIRWLLPKRCSNPALNCSHKLWLVEPKATLLCFTVLTAPVNYITQIVTVRLIPTHSACFPMFC